MAKRKRRRRQAECDAARTADQFTSAVAQLVHVNGDASAPSESEPIPPDEYPMSEDTYFRERTTLIEMEQKSADQHDKAILTLTAGALGLSLTFIDKIGPDPATDTLWLVGAAWLSFIVSIVVILASFLTSQSACRRQRELLDSEYSNGHPQEEANRFADTTHYLNMAAYVCFVVGVAFLAAFSWINFGKE